MATTILQSVARAAYAVGRRELTIEGRWMAATLAAGEPSHLAGQSAAELWGYRPELEAPIEIVIPPRRSCRVKGVRIRRSAVPKGHLVERRGIAVVSVTASLVQLAPRLGLGEIERAINEADRLDLIDPGSLHSSLEDFSGVAGVAKLRDALDRRTFSMSRSELERTFRSLAREVGLPPPETCVMHNGYEVDFLWRDLGLVVETDGLRHHRTAAQQTRDRRRDQAHLAAGDHPLRFTHSQVHYEREHVERTLARIAARLRAES